MPKPPDEELVRGFILSLPAATEGTHHGHPDFRVDGHIFAGLSPDRRTLNLRCDPVNLSFLVQASPEVYRDAWGGKWLGITLARAQGREVFELLMDAWKLAAPKSLGAKPKTKAKSSTKLKAKPRSKAKTKTRTKRASSTRRKNG